MPATTVEPVEIENPHPGAGPDSSDFYDMFGGPAVETGSNDPILDEVEIFAANGSVSGTLNLDLNKAFADIGNALRSSADNREASSHWDFDVSEVLVTIPAGGNPQSGSNGSVRLSLVMVNYMKDGSVWIDTDRDMTPDLHVVKNSAGEWWADRNMDGKADTLVGYGDYFFGF